MGQNSEGSLQTSPAAQEEGYQQIFFPWMTPMALSRT
jgi:hypothetical protein